MDLSIMRTLVRRDLKDEDNSNYRWQDNEIDRVVQRALAELSRYSPREMKTALATADGSREIDISVLTDRVMVDRVEFPVDRTPRQFQHFVVCADIVFMTGNVEGDGTNCYIYWGKMHTLDAGTSTVPGYLEDVLALGTAAYAVLAQAQYRTDVAGIGGDRADTDYLGWGKAMLKEFKSQLRRFGRSRKFKVGTLYQGDEME
jgi:hypothetical protein